ncbi:helix-turn-helix domain-containing protein [Streptomyces sp. NBC_00588]|uniref:helix-turn-helix domain-containing protein n=1 Tax=Streptomyces sp. NBC_00588 TaxID=2975784 RepID=UPI002E81E7BF|nr:helix-turn-helix domain-containing protein [Streptomyces sp. NBC_00588]WUB40214.1 helix-turn-helix domain-containing protein [Streptomyces sp. NBC_00588]
MTHTSSTATLAEALVTAREAACLTQEDLAERSGVSVRAIRNLETGHTARPRKQSLVLIARALGLPPGEVGRLMRRSHPEGRREPAAPAPAELPAAPRHRLAGRQAHIDALRTHLSATDRNDLGTPAVVVGPPGAGKTALVLEAARGVRERFPDGQVFVDAHPGAAAEPFTPDELVRRVLRSLGAAQVADHPEEAGAQVRDALSRRRVLVVLDNVDNEGQVRPLLVDGARSAVLVAARRELPALTAQFRRPVDVLTEWDAFQVLEDLLGPARTRAERTSAVSILRSCARLPLALHIAGLWLSARPHRSLRDLADRLAYEQDRLRFLHIGDLSLQASVAAYYRCLPAPVRTALRRLKTVSGDFGVDDVVTHVTSSRGLAADLLDELVDRQMVHVVHSGHPGRDEQTRYRIHEAVRQYVAYCPPDSWHIHGTPGRVWFPQQAGGPRVVRRGLA